MNNRHLYSLTTILLLVGVLFFLYKVFYLQFPLQPHQHALAWDIEVAVRIKPGDGPVKLYLQIPKVSEKHITIDEQFLSNGYGMSIRPELGNRVVVWSKRSANREQVLYFRSTVIRRAKATPIVPSGTPELVQVDFSAAELLAAQAINEQARHRSADNETFVVEVLKQLSSESKENLSDNVKALLGRKLDTLNKLEIVIKLLAMEKIPARIIHGYKLQERIRLAKPIHWLEVYNNKYWVPFTLTGNGPGVPDDYFPWWQGKQPLIQVEGAKLLDTHISVSLNEQHAVDAAIEQQKYMKALWYDYSLLGLPLETQNVYKILLTVPLGVFLLVILRNIIGIKTFGTFMPVLIAMAFRETQLMWGVILFSLVVGIGLLIRFYLESLKLLLVPRLAALLIVVIMVMALISIVSHKLGIHYGLSVALFPMVILTMTIERMTIVWEERGAKEALQQGIGSLIVASITYLAMNIESIRYLLFTFPELLLVLLAITLLLGRYSGYRLMELKRFKVLNKAAP